MNRLIPAIATACFALASVVHAQAPSGDGKGPMARGGEHGVMKPCSQEPDPAKCEANRKAMRENMKAAHQACENKPDRRACMTEQYCAKSPDPAKCQMQAKERQAKMSKHMDERQKMHEACNGKRGEELGKCLHEQREKLGLGHHRRG
jgi:hypothetical protein